MKVYCTSKNTGPSYSSDPIQMTYLGTSIKEAEACVDTFIRYQREEKDWPVNYRDIYTALPRDVEWEMIQFYSADGWWHSIVMFELEEPIAHEIEVFSSGVTCTCGYNKETTTGSRAGRLAHIHSQNNKPSAITDHRYE